MDDQLEEVRERRGVLEGVRRVHVEEPTPVGAELLDRDLRCRGPEREDLLRAFSRRGARAVEQRGRRRAFERLHHALRHEQSASTSESGSST
jgi:hypothetical protein